jgi:hypothetical protein
LISFGHLFGFGLLPTGLKLQKCNASLRVYCVISRAQCATACSISLEDANNSLRTLWRENYYFQTVETETLKVNVCSAGEKGFWNDFSDRRGQWSYTATGDTVVWFSLARFRMGVLPASPQFLIRTTEASTSAPGAAVTMKPSRLISIK